MTTQAIPHHPAWRLGKTLGAALAALCLMLPLASTPAQAQTVVYPMNQITPAAAVPAWSALLGNNNTTNGYRFKANQAVSVTQLGFYPLVRECLNENDPTDCTEWNTGRTFKLSLWEASLDANGFPILDGNGNPTGVRLATADIVVGSTAQWQFANLTTPIALTAGQEYVVSYFWTGEPDPVYSLHLVDTFDRANDYLPINPGFTPTGAIQYVASVLCFEDNDCFPNSFNTGYHPLADIGYVLPEGGSCDLTDALTLSQGGWSSTRASSPLADSAFFSGNFASGLVVGSSTDNSITLSSAQAVRNFLPNSGTPAALTKDWTNPTNRQVRNTLAGQAVAATLNLALTPGIAGAIVQNGPFSGVEVQAVLDQANAALAGASPVSKTVLSNLTAALDGINHSFSNGYDSGFLACASD